VHNYPKSERKLFNQNAAQAAINQTDIVNMTFSIVRGPEKIDACTQTHYIWLLHNFTMAIWNWGPRDAAQLFSGNENVDQPGAAYLNTTDSNQDNARWAASYIKYVGASDAERARRSAHEMAHNLNATDTTCETQGEGVVWVAYEDEGGKYLEYVSLMQYINCSGPQYPTEYFSDGTTRIFDTVSHSGNNTKWILIAASRDLYRYY